MSLRTQFVSKVVFPIGDRILGRGLTRALEELHQTEWWQRDQLLGLQAERLQQLIAFAGTEIPHYQRVLHDQGLTPADIRTPADLPKLPLLTRDDLRAGYGGAIHPGGVRPPKARQGYTGGSSTGVPLLFLHDDMTADYSRAIMYRGWSWAGCPPGTRAMYLWGQALKKNHKAGLQERVVWAALGIKRVNAFRLDDELLRQCAADLQAGRYGFIYSYASAAGEVARYLQKYNIRPRGVRGVMTTAEVLLPEVRALLTTTFDAPVFDAYGSSEIQGVAYECDAHEGLHVGMEHVIVEIVDDQGVPLAPGTAGRLAITDLQNRVMPFIRYINGDEARMVVEPCKCGRHLDRLIEILGRTCDIIDGVNGRHVHSFYFASLFGALGWAQSLGLRQFQIVQDSATRLVVTLAMNAAPPSEEKKLLAKLTEFLGDMDFQIHYVSSLDSPSGKHRWTVNNLRTAPQT